ncbi:MAG: tetratricopeptide repeat protein, partial [Candidatus Cloacimonas sp.]|nr:SPOR domain-containing protein [Candidatus Cloacimonadota bacterium]
MAFYASKSSELDKIILTTLIISLILLSAQLSFAESTEWISQIESLYATGNQGGLIEMLNNYEPSVNSEKAAQLYYQAKLADEKNKMMPILKELTKRYPNEIYGQKGLLELANIALLERNYDESLSALQKLDKKVIADKEFHLSVVYLKQGKHKEAISSAQSYIKSSKDKIKKELAYLQIAEAYILSEQYRLAKMTLESMKSSDKNIVHRAMVDYKIAYCLEYLEDVSEAIAKYRQVIAQYPFTEYCAYSERRLYNLLLEGSKDVKYSDLSSVNCTTEDLEISNVTDLIIATQPEKISGQYYLQVNAFSNADNAREHSKYLNSFNFTNIVFTKTVNDKDFSVVAVGPFEGLEEAKTTQDMLKN